jgi:hypothetical protein
MPQPAETLHKLDLKLRKQERFHQWQYTESILILRNLIISNVPLTHNGESGQLWHCCFISADTATFTHLLGGWVDSRASLDAMENTKSLGILTLVILTVA